MAEEKSGEKKRKRSAEEWVEWLKNTPVEQWLATESEDDPFSLVMGLPKGPNNTPPWRKPKEPDEHKKN